VIFATYWFLTFACVVVPVYWLLWKPYARKLWLAAVCAVFHYHFAGPAGVLPIIFLGIVTFLAAYSGKRKLCFAAIALDVFALAFYKYTQLVTLHALGLLNPQWGEAAWAAAHSIMPAAAPLAISFFTFEFVHYLYDVSHGSEPIRNPLTFLVFAIFFPSLVAGPIKRYQKFLPALEEGLASPAFDRAVIGAARIGIGLVKKLVIADNLTAWINFHVPRFQEIDVSKRWIAFFAIGIRILMDFSGYSDIALGLADMLGITLPENFNWPYFATNIQDFWQRWHISLSTWIRDYVYIPLGGGRHGRGRTLLNGLLAFSLCGLWHGAQWYYVFWGLYHGIGLVIYRIYHEFFWKRIEESRPAFTAMRSVRWPLAVFGWVLTQAFVFIGWMFFFYPVKDALHYMSLML
jgi:alginate O-acetyltransferase complex protein AlgI